MEYQIGDIVECLPGFKTDWDKSEFASATHDWQYGGIGYVPHKVFVIRYITQCDRGQVLFTTERNGGIFANAVQLKKENFLTKKLTKTFDFV